MQLDQSPVEKISFRNYSFYIKRDDLLHPAFSGNKARKFYHFLHNEFPGKDNIISFGSPQSNALYSLSVLAQLKHWTLHYYVHHIPAYLQNNPAGNYLAAIQNGANIIPQDPAHPSLKIQEYIQQTILPDEKQAIFIPEGGQCKEAEDGIKRLAQEIHQWAKTKQLPRLNIFLPSGTGTTALYLQKNCKFRVLTCACVGGEEYLKKQFALMSAVKNEHPVVLPSTKKFHFGKLYNEFFVLWQALKNETGIEFDLLYDPLGWTTLLNYLQNSNDRTPILYLHQGGILGNQTMLPRYRRKQSVNVHF